MESNNRKILFFDIDGTLITNDGKRTFPEDAKEALRNARKNGHLMFINTGRVRANVEDFIFNDCFDGIVCGCGTHIIYNDEELFHHTLEQDYCKEIARKCRRYGFAALFEHAEQNGYDGTMRLNDDNPILEYFKKMNRKMVSDIEDSDFIFDKFAAWYDENSDIDGFRKDIGKDFMIIDREGNFVEVVPHGFSKATGIKYLLDYFDIPLENAYVFGDSNNDLEMIEYVPNSIAMKVCSDEVRKKASYITEDVMDGGIYKAMKHFGLF